MEQDNQELLFQIFENQSDFKMAVIELRAELQSLRAAIALHIAVPEKREAFLEAVETMRSKILESQEDYKIAKAAAEVEAAQLKNASKPFSDPRL